ncbi:esterase FE4-like [Galleria mellonella]|uniref:Carboxylic ester hydrolase n=1 Tax=Galleria mellonella TaxID=7137 RepID=A0A6J1WH31_GALME|nr:esterase FE4-like [Galleria mellonella]
MRHAKKLVLFTLFAMNLIEQPAPEVTIEQGTLSGKINTEGTVFEYIGIPYAVVNITNRFQAPLPPPTWKGVYQAVDEIYSCPQATKYGVMGTEDCLRANVYVPVGAQGPLPVMVFIHGGAFIFGSGGKLLYGPEFLVKHNVILVTFNYRLGALGFICLGIKEAPGNAGLKDQIAALRWIKKNIAAFGGDPDNITIFGESAGAASTSILLASEATDGLFNRAIVQSGSSITNWAINKNPVWVASLLTKELGYDTKDPHEIYNILSKLPYKELIALKPIKPLGLYFDTELLHIPCIEKPLPGVEPVLTDLPYNLLSKKPKNVSVIYGSNNKEGYFLVARETPETLVKKNSHYLFASDLEFDNEDIAAKEAKKVKEFYFGTKGINQGTIMKLVDVYTHLYFEMPTLLETDLMVAANNTIVYNYYFEYSGSRNVLKSRTTFKDDDGACHADELFYLFNSRIWPFSVNRRDKKIVDWITKLWTNFAKYGHPTPDFQSDLPVRWIPSNRENKNFLYINDELKMGSLPNVASYNLWKYMYNNYRRTNLSSYF